MVQIKAASVAEYLEKIPTEARPVIETMRKLILKNLPKGYVESINWGMICYEIPLKVFPDTYNGQPLMLLGLAAQKNYYVLHMMTVYASAESTKRFQDAFKKAGKKLDMGKACVRFKKLDDLPLDVIAQEIARVPAEKYIAFFKASRKKK